MSKAEKRACQYTGYCKNESYSDFLNGYKQAEKDNELTWEDIEKICLIAKEVHQFRGFWSEHVYKEVLKRFKDFKERKEK
jgi:hypothetical protein